MLTFFGHSSREIDEDWDIKVHPFVTIIGFVCFMHVLSDGRHYPSHRIVPRENLWSRTLPLSVTKISRKIPRSAVSVGQSWGKASFSCQNPSSNNIPKDALGCREVVPLPGLPQQNLLHGCPKDQVLCKCRIHVIPVQRSLLRDKPDKGMVG